MKKVLLAASIASALSLFNIAQAANSGTITFNGEITDATCDVGVNGDFTTGNGTVTLPTVSKSVLYDATPGTTKTTGVTKFTIDAKNCDMGSKTKVQAFFRATAAEVDPVTGFLWNKEPVATASSDVALRIKHFTSGNIVDLNNSRLATGGSDWVTVSGTSPNGIATMPYSVEYITKNDGSLNSSGSAALAAGKVLSTITYELQYD